MWPFLEPSLYRSCWLEHSFEWRREARGWNMLQWTNWGKTIQYINFSFSIHWNTCNCRPAKKVKKRQCWRLWPKKLSFFRAKRKIAWSLKSCAFSNTGIYENLYSVFNLLSRLFSFIFFCRLNDLPSWSKIGKSSETEDVCRINELLKTVFDNTELYTKM